MKLILIHGRAQGGKDSYTLRETWINTLEKGLNNSGLRLPIPKEDIIFPYYGDLLDNLVDEFNTPVENIVKKGADSNFKDARFFHDFLKEVADYSKISLLDIENEKTSEITEKGPLNWEWVHSILKAIDKKSSWSEASIKLFTHDVYLYLTIPAIRQKINEKVNEAFNTEQCVVVGHSLGSIVSYNILREASTVNVCKLITVGSPLGINAVKNYLKTPIKMPDSVKNGWFNGYDERDIVALKPLNNEYFNISPSIKNKNDVDNHTLNHHGIEGYLNDKDIAMEIYKALTKDFTY